MGKIGVLGNFVCGMQGQGERGKMGLLIEWIYWIE